LIQKEPCVQTILYAGRLRIDSLELTSLIMQILTKTNLSPKIEIQLHSRPDQAYDNFRLEHYLSYVTSDDYRAAQNLQLNMPNVATVS